jgi:hypothetical protein
LADTPIHCSTKVISIVWCEKALLRLPGNIQRFNLIKEIIIMTHSKYNSKHDPKQHKQTGSKPGSTTGTSSPKNINQTDPASAASHGRDKVKSGRDDSSSSTKTRTINDVKAVGAIVNEGGSVKKPLHRGSNTKSSLVDKNAKSSLPHVSDSHEKVL